MNINKLTGTNLLLIGAGTYVFPAGTTQAKLSLGDYSLWTIGNYSITAGYSTNAGTYTNAYTVWRFVDDTPYGGVTVNVTGGGSFNVTPGAEFVANVPFGAQWDFTVFGQGFNQTALSFPTNQDGVCRFYYGPAYMLQNLTNHVPTGGTVVTNWSTNGAPGSFQFSFTLDKEYDSIDLKQGEAIAYNTGFMRQEDMAAWKVGFDLGLWLCAVYLGTKIALGILKEKTIGTAD